MGLRETLNKNPAVVGGIGIVAVLIAVWMVYKTVTNKGYVVDQPTQYYFTADDGKTLFAAPKTSIPPFEKDGKTAVLAHVFTCDKGKTQFVGYLSKFTDDFAKRAAAEAAKPKTEGQQGGDLTTSPGAAMATLVKKPGEIEWVPMTSGQGSNISAIFCPSRDPWDLVELYPKK